MQRKLLLVLRNCLYSLPVRSDKALPCYQSYPNTKCQAIYCFPLVSSVSCSSRTHSKWANLEEQGCGIDGIEGKLQSTLKSENERIGDILVMHLVYQRRERDVVKAHIGKCERETSTCLFDEFWRHR